MRVNCCRCCKYNNRRENFLKNGLQLQVENKAEDIVENNEKIKFDKYILNMNPDIIYADGEFTVNNKANYFISWEVMIDGSDGSDNITIAIMKNDILHSISCNPFVTGTVSGSAVIDCNIGDKISLCNYTGNKIRFASSNIQANIVIF